MSTRVVSASSILPLVKMAAEMTQEQDNVYSDLGPRSDLNAMTSKQESHRKNGGKGRLVVLKAPRKKKVNKPADNKDDVIGYDGAKLASSCKKKVLKNKLKAATVGRTLTNK